MFTLQWQTHSCWRVIHTTQLSFYRDEKLDDTEGQKCRDIVNELHNQMMIDFSDYRVPPSFFGPLQIVDYGGIGGNFIENVDDAEFIINCTNSSEIDTAKEFTQKIEKLT